MKFKDSVWEYDDFEFEENVLLGFSKQGREKAETNKNLVLPGITKDKLPVVIIGYDAFRGNRLQSIDLSSCVSLREIGRYAFAANKITKVVFDNCADLKIINSDAFVNNKIQSLNLSSCKSLRAIRDSAFADNEITELDLNSCTDLRTIASYAFAKNNIQFLNLSACITLQEIREGAFFNSLINEVIIDLATYNNMRNLMKNIARGNMCKVKILD